MRHRFDVEYNNINRRKSLLFHLHKGKEPAISAASLSEINFEPIEQDIQTERRLLQ